MNLSPFLFLLVSLATFRLSVMVGGELGPGDIFRRLREFPRRGSSLAKGLSCPRCLSVWFANLLCGACVFLGWMGMAESVLASLAASAVSVLLSHWSEKPL